MKRAWGGVSAAGLGCRRGQRFSTLRSSLSLEQQQRRAGYAVAAGSAGLDDTGRQQVVEPVGHQVGEELR
jgi:hypothetical protein